MDVEELRILWARNITNARKNNKLSQAELARRLDVRRSTVSFWESGQRTPRDQHRMDLARELHMDVAVLFPMIDFDQAVAK